MKTEVDFTAALKLDPDNNYEAYNSVLVKLQLDQVKDLRRSCESCRYEIEHAKEIIKYTCKQE